jgi:hypothetical protein
MDGFFAVLTSRLITNMANLITNKKIDQMPYQEINYFKNLILHFNPIPTLYNLANLSIGID